MRNGGDWTDIRSIASILYFSSMHFEHPIYIKHPVGRSINSDWFVNSFTMVFYKDIFFSRPLHIKF